MAHKNINQESISPSQLKGLLSTALQHNFPVMVTGAPGVGKTDIVREVVTELDFELVTKITVTDSPIDYKGLGFKVEGKNQAAFLPFGDILKFIEEQPRPVVCFMDDIGHAPGAVQAAAMQMILARIAGNHKLHESVRFIAATNRLKDGAGVNALISPLRSRFMTIVELVPDHNDWLNWAAAHGMPPELIAFIRFKPKMLFDPEPAKMTEENLLCPRTVAAVGKWLLAGLPEDILFQVIAGAAGKAFAIEFVAFLKVARSLSDPKRVFIDPEGVPIPDEIAARTSLVSTVAANVTRDTADAFFKFSKRLPVEMATYMVEEALLRTPAIANTRPYTEYLARHSKTYI